MINTTQALGILSVQRHPIARFNFLLLPAIHSSIERITILHLEKSMLCRRQSLNENRRQDNENVALTAI